MTKFKGNKGVILLMVLATVLIVALLANIILRLISTQYKLTHHQIARIQAYYAAMAGVNYALDNLRRGAWTVNSCLESAGGCPLNDSDFPDTIIQPVTIIIRPSGSADCINPPNQVNARISVTANYASPS